MTLLFVVHFLHIIEKDNIGVQIKKKCMIFFFGRLNFVIDVIYIKKCMPWDDIKITVNPNN